MPKHISFTPTSWSDDTSPYITAAQLNRIEGVLDDLTETGWDGAFGDTTVNTLDVDDDGDTTDPAIRFRDSGGSLAGGLYTPASNTLGVLIGSTERLRIATDLVSGSALDWQDYTPVLTNLTQGNGTIHARYFQIGNTVSVHFSFTLGSSSVVATGAAFAIPLGMSFASGSQPVGNAMYVDSGAATYLGQVYPGTGGFLLRIGQASGSYTQDTGITASVPFSWTTNDRISVSATFEIA